jgi:hypothetical protein
MERRRAIQKATLSDAEVQGSIADFISEARQCAQRGHGFAAMSTIFNVVLAVSEAVNGGRASNKDLFQLFVPQLTDKTSWLVKSGASPSDNDIASILEGIRNGMAHALSMPVRVMLVNTIIDARATAKSYPDNYVVSTTDFVDVVVKTVAELSRRYSKAQFDRNGGSRRGPATGQTIQVTNVPPSHLTKPTSP